jgi:hypothetical protein
MKYALLAVQLFNYAGAVLVSGLAVYAKDFWFVSVPTVAGMWAILLICSYYYWEEYWK